MTRKALALVTALIALSGCTSAHVNRGALIGAASGLVAGGAVGLLITDDKLLGSAKSKDSGNIALPKGGTLAASVLVGTVFGAIIGAMVGHQRETPYEQPEKVVPTRTGSAPAPAPEKSANDKQQARAPYLSAVRLAE